MIYDTREANVKVLSVRQPFADLIVRGIKEIENRTWQTPYRGLAKLNDYVASPHYAALLRERRARQRARMIVSGFACSRTHRIFSGNEPEGGVENVCGLTGRARHSGRCAPSLR